MPKRSRSGSCDENVSDKKYFSPNVTDFDKSCPKKVKVMMKSWFYRLYICQIFFINSEICQIPEIFNFLRNFLGLFRAPIRKADG